VLPLALVVLILLVSNIQASLAKTFTLGTDYSSRYKIAEPVFAPEPEISAELKEQCFKSCCIAKFLIKADGNTSVHLLTSSGSDEVDEIAVETLRRWRFRPAQLDGKPVDSSRKVRVEFEIE
jgi:protein TonB